VSSKEQEETGYSLPAQEKLLRDYADRKNYNSTPKGNPPLLVVRLEKV
jgi:hypothetical protein